MQGVNRVVDACRGCGRRDLVDVLSFGPTPLANGFLDRAAVPRHEPRYPLDVAACPSCGMMCLRHVVSPEELFRHYLYVSPDSTTLNAHMEALARSRVSALGLGPGDLVVEIGSNIGSQLAFFRAAGPRVLGVDPAVNLAAAANRRGIETLPEFFGARLGARLRAERGPARLILARHVLAHVDDLTDLLDGVGALLAGDGRVVVEVPYLLDLLADNQFDTIYHEHLSYFSVGSLVELFTRHGFHVVDVERAAVHGGSIVVSAAPAGAPATTAPAVFELLDLERRAGLRDPRRYREFAHAVGRSRRAVGDLVRQLAAGGARVAGYGAPAKGNALFNACGLDRSSVLYCTDTTDLKQGKVLPGTHIPVWSPEQAQLAPPDYYLLLAWNYADEIIRREVGFLDGGGRFIVPIPAPVVVSAESVRAVAD